MALLIVCLVCVACLAVYAWLQKPATRHVATHHAVQTAAVVDDGLIFEGYASGWPEHLVATAMFQCGPPAAKDNRASLVVWTDKANHVIAFGPAQEGRKLTANAAAMSADGAVDASQSIHVARAGHVIRTAGKKNTLQLNGVKLECIRTWDD